MSGGYKEIMKALKFKVAAKAVKTFDRSTVIVVSVCWGAAILMVLIALYSVILSASTRRAAETAAASEPILPKTIHKPIALHDSQVMVDRLKVLFPDITITLNNDATVLMAATDGAKFREWLTSISYIDVMSPQYRWTIKDFCVGKCGNGALMHALLSGEKISFEAPQASDKEKH